MGMEKDRKRLWRQNRTTLSQAKYTCYELILMFLWWTLSSRLLVRATLSTVLFLRVFIFTVEKKSHVTNQSRDWSHD